MELKVTSRWRSPLVVQEKIEHVLVTVEHPSGPGFQWAYCLGPALEWVC